jgi:SAM-dependent methyltransferase
MSVGRYMLRLISRKNVRRPESYDQDYFDRVLADTPAFLSRFGIPLQFAGKRVLDVGCGHGATCIYLAQHGAARVVGLDIDERRLTFARERLASAYPHLSERVTFESSLREEQFDLILSKDVLEHVDDLEGTVARLVTHLAPGGRLAMGWGPLWYSPYGGHITFMTRVPWIHLLLPERVIAQERQRYRPDEPASSIFWVNKLPYARYEQVLNSSGLSCQALRINVLQGRFRPVIGCLINALRRLPGLREYCTVNVYGVWTHPTRPESGRLAAPAPAQALAQVAAAGLIAKSAR